MTPEQFVVWLKAEVDTYRKPGQSLEDVADRMEAAMAMDKILQQLTTVVIKTQPAQPGVPGILGQGLVRLEKAEDVAWASADPTEVRVFNGGGCQ